MKAGLKRIHFNFSEAFSNIAGLTPLLSWLQHTNFPLFPCSFNRRRSSELSRLSRVGPLMVGTGGAAGAVSQHWHKWGAGEE